MAVNEQGRVNGLDRVHRPASIAIVGASDRAGRIGATITTFVARSFRGDLHLINPSGRQIGDRPSYKSLADAPQPVDLVIAAVRAEHVCEVVAQAVERGDGGVLIVSAGFAEVDQEVAVDQDALVRLTAGTGTRILGPNCLGIVNAQAGVYATFTGAAATDWEPGPVAIATQSGGVGAMLVAAATRAGLKAGNFWATGNEADVDLAEVIEFYADRPEVRVILSFCEGIRDGQRFVRALQRARATDTSVIMIKAGASDVGARAALSHTAAIAGSDAVVDTVLAQEGVMRVETIEDAVDLARFALTVAPRLGRRVAIVTGSGGHGALMADLLAVRGASVPAATDGVVERLASALPDFGSASNPFDLTGQIQAEPQSLCAALEPLTDGDFADVTVVCLGPLGASSDGVVDAIVEAASRSRTPIVASWASAPPGRIASLEAAGVIVYDDPRGAANAIARRMAGAGPAPADGTGEPACERLVEEEARHTLGSESTYQVLDSVGVPQARQVVTSSIEDLVVAAEDMGYPVVLKATGLDHKSDVGGVVVGVGDAMALREEAQAMALRIRAETGVALEQFLVQEQIVGRLELACGLYRDDVFGPMVSVAIGGVLIEVIHCRTMLRVPFSRDEAVAAIVDLAEGRLVSSSRGLNEQDVERVADVLCALAELAMTRHDILEVDCNPLLVTPDGVVAVDGLIVTTAIS